MLVLAIDTSSAAVVAALVEVGADEILGIALRETVSPRGHTELLAPSIAQCLAEADAAPADIGAIVAGLGPGPFTGLRVGLVTAAAMAHALDVPSYGVCSLDAIRGWYDDAAGWSLSEPSGAEPTGAEPTGAESSGAESSGTDSSGLEPSLATPSGAGPAGAAPRPTLVVTDARRKEVYWAAYRDGVRVDGPAVGRPDDLPAARWATGAGATMYADVLVANGIPVLPREYPSAPALVRCAAERIRGGAPSEPLVPLYLRRPDAVPGVPKAVSVR